MHLSISITTLHFASMFKEVMHHDYHQHCTNTTANTPITTTTTTTDRGTLCKNEHQHYYYYYYYNNYNYYYYYYYYYYSLVDPRVLLGSPCLCPIGYLGYPDAILACEPNGLCHSYY
jgi:hypothetical protein